MLRIVFLRGIKESFILSCRCRTIALLRVQPVNHIILLGEWYSVEEEKTAAEFKRVQILKQLIRDLTNEEAEQAIDFALTL